MDGGYLSSPADLTVIHWGRPPTGSSGPANPSQATSAKPPVCRDRRSLVRFRRATGPARKPCTNPPAAASRRSVAHRAGDSECRPNANAPAIPAWNRCARWREHTGNRRRGTSPVSRCRPTAEPRNGAHCRPEPGLSLNFPWALLIFNIVEPFASIHCAYRTPRGVRSRNIQTRRVRRARRCSSLTQRTFRAGALPTRSWSPHWRTSPIA